MPGYITHYLCGQATVDALPSKIGAYIAPMQNLYNLGTQGPDIFFYYVPGFLTKRIRDVGTDMHNSNLGQFLLHMADIARDYISPSGRRIVFAYTAGFLAHYALDVATHGYVYGQTYHPPEPKLEETTRHRHFETCIDVLMLERLRGQKPGEYALELLIVPDEIHKRAAAVATSQAIRQVYERDIRPQDVYKAMGQMAQFTNLLQSGKGRRKAFLGRGEELVLGTRIISSLIHMQDVDDGRDYLNLEETPWSAPWAEDVRKESFVELFGQAVTEATQMTDALFEYVRGNLSRDDMAVTLKNRSLKTGIDGGRH